MIKPFLMTSCVVLAGLAPLAAQPAAPATPARPASKVVDDPRLPRVLIIGDSISIGYTDPVRALLKGKANVHRIPANGGPTTRGLENLEAWLEDGRWDVIHFNFGLHDQMSKDSSGNTVPVAQGKPQVPLDQYEQNLDRIVTRLEKTGAKLIWASTTPVPLTDKARVPADAPKYNAAALRVMEKQGVTIDDLEAFARPRLDKIQRPGNVHFTDDGYKVLAEQVARSIEAALVK